ncbi:hypothetical protein [Haloparvum sedimenti]|uniref:hypothetical protein n=1 Tax=Haloparvum sedimenti TaxID=1678448 RepID=UPI00071E7AB7|nr:hypothetical protein [Haloparvum sedimenti]
MDVLLQYVIAVAAAVTATAAVGTATAAYATYRVVRRHERALFGEEAIDAWDGLIEMVGEHRAVLRQKGYL